MKKIYVLDTSVLLHDSNSIFEFKNNDIVIPLKVLQEVDKHKTKQDLVGFNARNFIKTMDELRSKGDIMTGISLGKKKGSIKAVFLDKTTMDQMPIDLDRSVPDNQIIATAFQVKNTQELETIMVSRDINLRTISDAVGIKSITYESDQVVKDSSELYTGSIELVVDDEFITRFYSDEKVILDHPKVKDLYPHQFVMMISNKNEKKTALARFISKNEPLKAVNEYSKKKNSKVFDALEAKNREQAYAFDLLLDDNVKVVSLVGIPGSGKTVAAIAAGLQQTLSDGKYNKFIIARPVQPMGKDIGFLPGTVEEKLLPWMAPVQDSLEFLIGDKVELENYISQGIIEMEALTYIRGRSIAKAFMLIDECQNLSPHEIKTILTRVGDGTKIVLTGDVEQIDAPHLNETSNGLSHVIEKFKDSEIAGHITLLKGERSIVATEASKRL